MDAANATVEQLKLSDIDIANRVDQISMFGLVTLRGHLANARRLPAWMNVSAGGFKNRFAFEDCAFAMPDGSWRWHVNLMTHLMDNGIIEAEAELEWSDGSRQAYRPKRMVIANVTPLAAAVAADLRAHGTAPILPRYIDSAMFPYAKGQARAWFDADVDAVDVPLSFEQATSSEAAERHLRRWGFCILPDLLSDEIITNFRKELDEAIASGKLPYEAGSSQRIHNAHRLEWGRKIWLYPQVMAFLQAHFRDTPCACQTLTYVNGSEQNAHQDTIHLTPYPAGYMCGVWIALEDVQPNSGELFVYPGSHRAPRLRAGELGLDKVDEDYSSYAVFDAAVRQLMEEGGFERFTYLPKAGQILVWHENLVHGGSPRLDREQTRTSIVSHYFAKGSAAYYDSRGEAAALESLPGIF